MPAARWFAVLVAVLAAVPFTATAAADGATLYATRCAICHDGQLERAPRPGAMAALSPDAVVAALTDGRMRAVGAGLSPAEKRAIAEFVGSAEPALPTPAATLNRCTAAGDAGGRGYWNGWGVDARNLRYQPAERAGLTVRDVRRLELRWAFGFPGEIIAYGQPAVVAGRLYVGTQLARVYALDADSGCQHWLFRADAGVRTAITVGEVDAGRKVIYFGDQRGQAYAVDALSGELVWKTAVDTHAYAQITGSPVLYGGRLYVPVSSFEEVGAADPGYPCCTFSGALAALDAETGEILWKTATIADAGSGTWLSETGRELAGPSGAAIWSAPTVDSRRGLIYAVTGNNYSGPATETSDAIIAFDLETGERRWVYQALPDDLFNVSCIMPDLENCPRAAGPDFGLGASPLLLTLMNGERRLFAGQKSGMLYALDPDADASELYRLRTSRGGARGGIQWGMASDGHQLFVPISNWAANQYVIDEDFGADLLPGFFNEGGLRALDAATGEALWYAKPAACAPARAVCAPAHSAAVTAIPGAVFAGTLDGRLRAYSSVDGALLWEFDTLREFATVNGVAARGGAIDGPGPVIVDGVVYVNSGYGRWSSPAGNVLLAFAAAPAGGLHATTDNSARIRATGAIDNE